MSANNFSLKWILHYPVDQMRVSNSGQHVTEILDIIEYEHKQVILLFLWKY